MRFLLFLLLPFLAALDGCGGTNNEEAVTEPSAPAAGESLTKAIYKDASQPTKDRIEDLIGRMTVEEKVAQVTAVWKDKKRFYNEDFSFNADSAFAVMPHGIGHITRPSELEGPPAIGRSGLDEVNFTNAIQKWLVENTRLGIPALNHEESLHGLAALNATSWGQPISVAATFNRDLTRQLYATAARQTASRGGHVVLTPVVDVARDPRWGRVEETLGEDPFLAAQIGLQAVLGFQGDDNKWDEGEVFATLKHMAGHGEPEGGNNIAPANISERTLREVFLYPFRHIVEKGNVRNIMASYNEVNGIPSHANGWMLNTLLRDTWGYKGAVVSDYFAVRELTDRHAVALNWKAAAVLAISSGIDIELPDREAYPALVEAVNDGTLDEAILNQAVSRILQQKFDRGLFENPYTDPAGVLDNTAEDDALVRKAGAEGMILLTNDGILPFTDKIKTIAVVGPNADKVLLGGYSDMPDHFVTIKDGLENALGADSVNLIYAEGARVVEPGSWYKDPVVAIPESEDRLRIKAAARAVRQADVIVLAVGGNELTSREAWAEGHWGDRPTLDMAGLQNELIDELAKTGKPIVGLVFGGRPLDIANLIEKSSAVFQCFYLGQETGNSVADVLFGKVAPGGKLPISLPRSVGHIPAYYNYKPTARRGYLFDDVSAAWPFGYGLSYTTFNISPPTLSAASVRLGEAANVKVTVSNTGTRAGSEVVQLYIRDRFSSVTRPVRELKGFEKVYLEPGESTTVTFELGQQELELLDINMKWTVEPGEFEVMVGNSSRLKDLKSVVFTVR
ncbi:glycoside hydrolase family 3 N-terminal domain-containing protein [Neolewinella agarilytica]|uniref:Beta-glucosidase n=1 Tax=Neolewinella agarilytica TaxID=478744 RepID=A0A1H9K5S6_9BACT|nr:glycoside hydrolase family 3 N-terminal domain-containing protein [Neolewinella agarilytica]SEQ94195.1 beta-glucosidase [Neolewinella agarilytica]